MRRDMYRGGQAGPIRVVIADDHAILREPLRAWLEEEPDFEVVGEASGGGEAARLTEELRPDILLLDVWMPGLDGVEAAKMLRGTEPETQIVVLTADQTKGCAQTLAGLGVSGYLPKSTPYDQLVATLRLVYAGHTCLPRSAAARSPAKAEPTPREREILRLAMQGCPDKEIARRLRISPATARAHVRRLFAKAGVHSKVELVTRAHQLDWLGPASGPHA